MDQYQSMAFANAFLSAKGQWGCEDEYYRRYDADEVPRVRSLPIASAAALLVVVFVVSGVLSG